MMATVRTESVEGLTQSHEALLRFGRAFSMMCRRAAAGRQDVDFWHFARQIATFGCDSAPHYGLRRSRIVCCAVRNGARC